MQKVFFKEKAVTVCSVHDKEGVFSKYRMKLSATSFYTVGTNLSDRKFQQR